MEADKCHELGLGRGVNITDPQMWKNKSSFCVREVAPQLNNIVWTEEGGLKEIYEKEVSTVATEQLKLKFSVEEPSSQVKIGMDAHYSQSTSSAKRINGIKIKTRSVGFRVDFDDLPSPFREKKVKEDTDGDDSGTITSDFIDDDDDDDDWDDVERSSDCFESRLSSWILKRIYSREKKRTKRPPSRQSTITESIQKRLLHRQPTSIESSRERVFEISHRVESPPADPPSACKTLRAWLRKEQNKSEEMKTVAKDCEVFVRKLGITHYVSAIELGALKYNVSSISSKKTKMGVNAELGFGSLAEGGLGKSIEKHLFHKMKMEQEIGRINKDGEVERDTPSEAVIGFQIQPIYKLVRSLPIQVALQRAIKEYIQTRSDKTSKT